MATVPVFVGLDYHDVAIEVNVMDRRGEIMASRRCNNCVGAVRAAVPPNCTVVGAAIEADRKSVV